MNPETFFDKFGLLADTPNGVQKLREFILQLAVQGKLVSQDPNDEPAAVLLEKIKTEKGKNAKKLKSLPPVSEGEIYFELPIGWQWVRFDDICSYIQRGKGPKYVEKSNIPVISQKCIQWDGFKLDRARFISPSALEKYNEERFLCTGDLLWNSTGTGTVGRVNAYVHEDNSYDKVVADSHVTVVRPILLNSRFIYCWIASPIIQNEIEEMASGTTNQIELNLSTIKNHLVPLAPLNEQRRIVAKVDQLMALCDELEARQQKKQETRLRLNNAALDKMLTAHEPAEFTNHWQRVCDNFDLLYDNPETVGELREAIIALACVGSLTKKWRNEHTNIEPAHSILSEIINENKNWYDDEIKLAIIEKRKKPKKPQLIPIDIEKGIDLFKIPTSWVFCYFEGIAASKNNAIKAGPFGSSLTKSCYVPSGHKIYGQEQVIKGDAFYGDYYIDKEKFLELKSCEIASGDILISLVGTMGKVLILPDDCEPGIINPRLVKISLNSRINKRFIKLYLNSYLAKSILNEESHGGTMKILNLKILKKLPIPLPPREEQDYIINKVDQLMALCDDLEAKLNQSQTDGAKLMEAVVAELVGA